MTSPRPSILEFKGSMLTLMVLYLHSADSSQLEAELERRVRQAPGMFKHAPVVVDLQFLHDSQTPLDIPFLDRLLRRYGINPVGVRGGNPTQHALAVSTGLSLMPESKLEKTRAAANPERRRFPPAAKVVTQPVRSGQQVVAAQGDLVVLSMVSPGAEILAQGNIHVYGALRGRALAGVDGNEQARIVCLHFDAELVSVAGQYQVSEEYEPALIGKPVQVYLENDLLTFQGF